MALIVMGFICIYYQKAQQLEMNPIRNERPVHAHKELHARVVLEQRLDSLRCDAVFF